MTLDSYGTWLRPHGAALLLPKGKTMYIDFEFQTTYGKFSDALWFPEGEELPSDTEIEAMKQQRLNDWIAAITTPQE